MPDIHTIDGTDISGKRVIMRVDFNVSLNPDHSIADDARIQAAIPTLKYLLEHKNKLVLMSHLGRPKGRDPQFSLAPVAAKLQEYLPSHTIKLVDDFLSDRSALENQQDTEILLLENIRFYPEEKKNDAGFARELSHLGDVYVNDAFGCSHRAHASVVGITEYLPSYAGLLLKREIEMISRITENPEHPVVAILGGSKISSKIHLVERLLEIADYLVLGGGIANTFLQAQGYGIGKSIAEYEEEEAARKMLFQAVQKNTRIIFPADVVVAGGLDWQSGEVKGITEVPEDMMILDIGPETQARIGTILATARTIVWNGPVGYFENAAFRRGTDFIYYAITENTGAVSIVGGGDTLSAISKKEYLDKITHISTGGGAMLEFIEKGTLPGIEALRK
ncbi:MAG: phosphoglycerate kinase [Patescibacteria group bacterium]|nr:phosphoglycerate kinase [Patescibacteria group bacterium]